MGEHVDQVYCCFNSCGAASDKLGPCRPKLGRVRPKLVGLDLGRFRHAMPAPAWRLSSGPVQSKCL